MRRHIVLFSLSLILSYSLFSQTSDFNGLNEYLEKMTDLKLFSGTVLMAQGDSIVFHRAFGPADAAGQKQNQTDSEYLIGSITKTFTAVAIMQLQEREKLSLGDPLSKYVPLFPNSENITIRHLLAHRSGIKNYTDLPEMNEWKYETLTPAEIVEKVIDFKPLFNPGELFVYSNTNYILLGMIIEQVTGENYADYIKNNLLNPANMNSTGMDYRLADRLSQGLINSDGTWLPEPLVNPSIPYASGAFYSTTGDLLRFSNALFNWKFFKYRSSLDAILNFEDGYYGLGILSDQADEYIYFGHSGGIDGYAGVWQYFKGLDLHIIVLANSSTSEIENVSLTALKAFEGKPFEVPEERRPLDLSAEQLRKMEGTYKVQLGLNVAIYLEENKLMAKATGQNPIELMAETETRFFSPTANMEMEFKLGDEGVAESLILMQAGEQYYAPRMEERKSISLSQAELEILEGRYELQEGYFIEVFVENGHLLAQVTGREPFRLMAESRSRFFATEQGMDMEFTFGEDGETNGVTLFQAGGSYKAPKVR